VLRTFRRVSVVLAVLLPLAVLAGPPASASSESEFVSRTQGARASAGVRAYGVRSDLASVARRQAGRMAARHSIYHNPNLGSEVSNWEAVGENVGTGSTVAAIHNAFMGSSSHRENILSTSFTEVGIGTATGSDGKIYVSEVFRRPMGGSSYVPPPAPPARTPVVVRRVVRRASRSAPRQPLSLPRPAPRRPVAVKAVPPVTAHLPAAWTLYRRARPVGSLDRAVTYLRTCRVIGS
jgi:hypothetical protein